MGAREVISSIHGWMAGLRRAVMANSLKAGALIAVAGFVTVSLLIMILESLGNFSGAVRGVLLGIWSLSALAALGMGIVWPILKHTVFASADKSLAKDFAQRMPSIRDRVLNALQLLERVEPAERLIRACCRTKLRSKETASSLWLPWAWRYCCLFSREVRCSPRASAS